MEPRKTLFDPLHNDRLGHRLDGYVVNHVPQDVLKERAAREFMRKLEQDGFTTHLDIVKEFMDVYRESFSVIYSFPRFPEPATDTSLLCGGPWHGQHHAVSPTESITVDVLDDVETLATSKHRYLLQGLNVAAGVWEYRYDQL